MMAREMAEMVKKLPKLDWTQRESVRADLCRKVRRLLAMYGYPPDCGLTAEQSCCVCPTTENPPFRLCLFQRWHWCH
ncbi:MAG: type I restriction enzyme endonuclease domain-containing protein [Planctomycetota bacterium]